MSPTFVTAVPCAQDLCFGTSLSDYYHVGHQPTQYYNTNLISALFNSNLLLPRASSSACQSIITPVNQSPLVDTPVGAVYAFPKLAACPLHHRIGYENCSFVPLKPVKTVRFDCIASSQHFQKV